MNRPVSHPLQTVPFRSPRAGLLCSALSLSPCRRRRRRHTIRASRSLARLFRETLYKHFKLVFRCAAVDCSVAARFRGLPRLRLIVRQMPSSSSASTGPLAALASPMSSHRSAFALRALTPSPSSRICCCCFCSCCFIPRSSPPSPPPLDYLTTTTPGSYSSLFDLTPPRPPTGNLPPPSREIGSGGGRPLRRLSTATRSSHCDSPSHVWFLP